MSNEWIEEIELSSEIIRLETPSITIQCQIGENPVDTLYGPLVGINIMSRDIVEQLIEDMLVTPSTKLLKSLWGV